MRRSSRPAFAGRGDRHGDHQLSPNPSGPTSRHGLDQSRPLRRHDPDPGSGRPVDPQGHLWRKLVAEDGAMRIDFSRPTYPDFMLKTVRPPATPTAADFMVKTARPDGPVKVRCVGVSDTLLATDERQIVLRPRTAS